MKVRLKHEDGSPVFSTLEMFQFHEGPIKTNLARIEAGRYSGFNSMKVRLKPPPQGAEQGEKEFQFHEGPIKTLPIPLSSTELPGFNSMKVRLKHPPYSQRLLKRACFNSMKVRLKLLLQG